ncbi:MAG TPA: type VI secretion system contractile sheath large subunit [Gemmatimonadaceae bacterium]
MAKDPRFDVHLNAEFDAPPSEVSSSDAFRIAILGNFSGRAGQPGSPSLDRRRVWRVDRDDLDMVIAGIAPELRIAIDPSEPPVVVRFSTLDDFHPDALVERVPIFQQLRALRGAPAPQTLPSPQPRPAAGAARTDALLSGGSLLDQIVGNDPGSTSADEPLRIAPRDELTEFVDRAVRPHTIREASRDERALSAKVDEVIAATMRVLLHHPEFQALESLWRAVDLLVRRLDTGESLQIALVDVGRAELQADLEVGAPALQRLLGQGRWSLVVSAYSFGPDDVQVLAKLAALGQSSGASWIVGGDPRLAGTPAFSGEADPDDWEIPVPAGWDALRRSPGASHLSVVLPRFLVRLPYGARTDACSFPFEEMLPGKPDHASYLWGNGAMLGALAIGDAVAEGDEPATQATLSGFPLHVVHVDGDVIATPCTEALITHRAVAYMVDRGLTPLASPRDGDTILIPRLQSVASPARPLSFPRGSA